MARSTSVYSAFLIAAGFLSACTGSPAADQILAVSETGQRQAQLACQAEQGINIPEALNIHRLNDGRVLVSTVNGPGLPLAQARTINQCARAKLLNGQTTTAHEQLPAETAYAAQTIQQPADILDGPAGCIRGGGTIQGGDLICPGY